MSDIADAWEVYSQRELERRERVSKSRFCGECSHYHTVPKAVGNQDYGWCDEWESWQYGGNTAHGLECEDWR